MDKWKDIELEKMKAGGNSKFREFLESQDDYDPCWSMQEKYNSKAAALFRDQVSSVVCVQVESRLVLALQDQCLSGMKVVAGILIVFLPLLGCYSSWGQGVVPWNFSCQELDTTSA